MRALGLTRKDLLDRLMLHSDVRAIQHCHYVEGEHDDACFVFSGAEGFCRKHADVVARYAALETGQSAWIVREWSEMNYARRCAFGGCDVALEGCGLTSYGIDEALGITETDPKTAHVYGAALYLAADSMAPDDNRWSLWEHHVRHLLRRKKKP